MNRKDFAAGARPVPAGWPDSFDPEAAEAVIEVTLEKHRGQAGIHELIVELRWAIAQLRAERELT